MMMCVVDNLNNTVGRRNLFGLVSGETLRRFAL